VLAQRLECTECGDPPTPAPAGPTDEFGCQPRAEAPGRTRARRARGGTSISGPRSSPRHQQDVGVQRPRPPPDAAERHGRFRRPGTVRAARESGDGAQFHDQFQKSSWRRRRPVRSRRPARRGRDRRDDDGECGAGARHVRRRWTRAREAAPHYGRWRLHRTRRSPRLGDRGGPCAPRPVTDVSASSRARTSFATRRQRLEELEPAVRGHLTTSASTRRSSWSRRRRRGAASSNERARMMSKTRAGPLSLFGQDPTRAAASLRSSIRSLTRAPRQIEEHRTTIGPIERLKTRSTRAIAGRRGDSLDQTSSPRCAQQTVGDLVAVQQHTVCCSSSSPGPESRPRAPALLGPAERVVAGREPVLEVALSSACWAGSR